MILDEKINRKKINFALETRKMDLKLNLKLKKIQFLYLYVRFLASTFHVCSIKFF